MRYLFVTGGVCSSLGKGVAAASLGRLLEERGFSVCMIKVDPYINVDAGTMSPFQHGEVYVTDDGAETDLDLGNYARFVSAPLSRANSITAGQVYQTVISKEREGKYLGKCVQVVPHITDEIKRRLVAPGKLQGADITIAEIGGTVGDMESIPFLEAIRQIIHEKEKGETLSIHLTLVPTVTSGEVKTKPTQHSVKEMREIGIQPDILLCRCTTPLEEELRRKIALFTNIDLESVFSAFDVKNTIYEIPLAYHEQGLDELICRKMRWPTKETTHSHEKHLLNSFEGGREGIAIAVVGKYVELGDAYKSVDEALIHGAMAHNLPVRIVKIDAEEVEKGEVALEELRDLDGILIPGGFGHRGVNGMVVTARHARERRIPFLGICLGLQVMVIEFARSVVGMIDADSSEFSPHTVHSVVALLEEQAHVTSLGGTMRLGGGQIFLEEGTLIEQVYQKSEIRERHRHRYEVVNRHRETLKKAGLVIAATTSHGDLVEAVEWPDHPWGVGVQFHPEFTSQPLSPSPLFGGFIAAALAYKERKGR